jgi:hypothetical protein
MGAHELLFLDFLLETALRSKRECRGPPDAPNKSRSGGDDDDDARDAALCGCGLTFDSSVSSPNLQKSQINNNNEHHQYHHHHYRHLHHHQHHCHHHHRHHHHHHHHVNTTINNTTIFQSSHSLTRQMDP